MGGGVTYGYGSRGGRRERKSSCTAYISCDIKVNVGARLQQMVLACCWFSSWELGARAEMPEPSGSHGGERDHDAPRSELTRV